MSMYNLISTRRSSSIEIDITSSEAKHQPMDMMSTLSVDGGSLCMTVVIQPSRKQSLRLSFPGNYPIEEFNGHHRFESEDSVASQRYTLYSQESLGAISDISNDHTEGESSVGTSTQFDPRLGSSITLANCYREPRGLPSSCNMSVQNSAESAIDPLLSPRTVIAPTHLSAQEWRTIPSALEISSASHSFSPLPTPVVPNNQIIVRKGGKSCEVVPSTHLGLRPSHPIAKKMSPKSPSSPDIIDLFPSPPTCRALARFPIKQPSDRLCQDAEDDCFADWLQQIQDRFVSRQSELSKKEAILEFKHSILMTYNTTTLNQELPVGVDPRSKRIASFDFDTYHGLTNDAWKSEIYPQRMQMIPETRFQISTVEGASIDLCQEPVLSEEKALMTITKLEEAQRCLVKDGQGKKILFKDVIRHRQTLVIFLRFFWCAKCQEYVQSISNYFAPGTAARKQLDDTNSTVVFIGTGSWKMISSYRAMLGCSFEFYTDTTTTSRLFRKMGLHRILLGGSSDPSTLHKTLNIWQTMKASAKSIPKLPLQHPGSFTQLGGEFCFQNLAPDYPSQTIPKNNSSSKCLVTKFGLKSPRINRDNLLVAPRMDNVSSDPFRRSFMNKQAETNVHLNSLSTVRCIYVNRMKSSASHGNFHQLFKAVGVEFPE
ncbi:hypothetical protein PTTG_11997 [Puccinia triticina 1-1 BBBD Race 1]|uniref:Uncharacterized protein n=2 Tax=Puccinia triticina TaxID=208348 RepID=A0A180GNU6_PUCT1|nr:uncharacterized protein PtA15_12A374 [Puccinia triticina]OAV94476.1 hypothetical protein PTTG_11997 [Puccinia triticina 1-1 BBBD Race 1]WAQ90385.1 hypothetical protein PtA15_12A374 [Puccinia triticina]WAR61699.1 hypothetical protein PtB15_12B389 [Puccinia triticina]